MPTKVVEAELRAAHAGVGHHEDAAGVFDEAGFLALGEGGFGKEGDVPDAGGEGVQEPEVEGALVGRPLGTGGDVDCCGLGYV